MLLGEPRPKHEGQLLDHRRQRWFRSNLCNSIWRRFRQYHPGAVSSTTTLRLAIHTQRTRGLKASSGDYVILLNSDTIVAPGWLEALVECGQSDPRIGVLGPLSNAASFQSVPERRTPGGDWAVNSLPVGFSVEDMARLVSRLSEREFPRVPFVNGFTSFDQSVDRDHRVFG